MEILKILLLTIEVGCCALLIGVILIQKSKGQGMGGSAFGGGMGESLFGAQMGNVLTKITVVLAIVFLLNTVLLAWVAVKQARLTPADSISTDPIESSEPAIPSDAVPEGSGNTP